MAFSARKTWKRSTRKPLLLLSPSASVQLLPAAAAAAQGAAVLFRHLQSPAAPLLCLYATIISCRRRKISREVKTEKKKVSAWFLYKYQGDWNKKIFFSQGVSEGEENSLFVGTYERPRLLANRTVTHRNLLLVGVFY